MSQIDELLILGARIEEFFPEQIKNYFVKAPRDNGDVVVLQALRDNLWSDWASILDDADDSRLKSSFSLTICIAYVLSKYSPHSPEINKQYRNEFYEARRQKMKYRIGQVRSEYKKGGGELLSRAYEAYANYEKFAMKEVKESDSYKSYSRAEYMNLRMEETEAWFKDSDSNLIGYPFVRTLSFKQQADYLLSDISYHTYDIIKRKFGNDVTGSVGRFPKSLTDGVFSIQSGSDEVQFSVEEDSVVGYTKHPSGKKNVVRQVNRVEGDFGAAARTEEGKRKLVNQLVEKNVISPMAKRLDADDQQLFAIIYNLFRVGDDEPKEISVTRLAKALGKNGRERDCRDVLEKVHRLATSRVQRVELDDTTFRFSAPEFFSVSYEIKHAKIAEGKKGETLENVSLIQGEDLKSIVDVIDEMNSVIDDEDMKYKYSSVVLSLEPSNATKGYLMDSLNQIWLLSTYEGELPNRTKTVLRLLLSRRIDLYRLHGGDGSATETLPYEYFIENLRLETLRKSRLEETLATQLGVLKGENRLLKDFRIDKKARRVYIDYNAFSPSEIDLYRIDASNENEKPL